MSWKETTDELLELTYKTISTDISYRAKKTVINSMLRLTSNIISSEDKDIGQSSPTSRYGCKRWSEEAYKFYNSLRENGMTHKQACYGKRNGRSAYINEHQYPLAIAKKGLLKNEWSLEQLKDFMYNYGSYTVITKEEDLRLKPAHSILEGHNRYKDAGIKIRNENVKS